MVLIKRLAFAVLLLISLDGGLGSRVNIPDGITFGEFGEYVQKKISQKFPDLEDYNLKNLDPLQLGSLTVKNGNYVVENTNAVLSGLSSAKISGIDWDWANNKVSARVAANVTITSPYVASGEFLYLPMSTSGEITIYGDNADMDISFKYSKYMCDSVQYIRIHDLETSQKFGLLRFEVRTDSGCSTLDGLVNAALNTNWRVLESDPVQAIPVVSRKAEADLNKFFNKVPLAELRKYLK